MTKGSNLHKTFDKVSSVIMRQKNRLYIEAKTSHHIKIIRRMGFLK